MRELHSRIAIIVYLLVDWTSGKVTHISALDRCGQYVHFKDDIPYDVSWNGESGTCEVRFANDREDNSICAKAHQFSVECGFELRFTEGLGFIPVKTFTCFYNISQVQFCSKKGRSINVEFFAISPTSSKVALTVNQTKPVEHRSNPFLGIGIAKIAISCFTLLGLTLTSAIVYVKRRNVFPCFASPPSTAVPTTTDDVDVPENSGMLQPVTIPTNHEYEKEYFRPEAV
ncbi:uncharacterized protein LOC110454756 [Mizuhopecten yessoensis]|nr:uncharacterized protein LOC110454756 [Mizuhopecten yessoensis]